MATHAVVLRRSHSKGEEQERLRGQTLDADGAATALGWYAFASLISIQHQKGNFE